MVGSRTIHFIGGNMEAAKPNGIKILCIEDEYFISELYGRALRRAGYDVTIFLSGQDGLKAALTNQYDVILLDLMIPGITGFEVLREIRKQKPDLKSKILITTNLDQEDESKEELEKSADGYLIKAEFTPKQLVGIIDDVVNGKDLNESTME